MDVEAAHDARKAKAAEEKRKKQEQEQFEILLVIVFLIFVMAGSAIGLYELVAYCNKYGCGR
jgi:cytochrome c oxidase assembly protein Cox11